MEDDGYNDESGDEQANEATPDADVDYRTPEERIENSQEEDKPDTDPALASWFKVEEVDHSEVFDRVKDHSDTETEDDSDHATLPSDGEGNDDWLKVEPDANQAVDDTGGVREALAQFV